MKGNGRPINRLKAVRKGKARGIIGEMQQHGPPDPETLKEPPDTEPGGGPEDDVSHDDRFLIQPNELDAMTAMNLKAAEEAAAKLKESER